MILHTTLRLALVAMGLALLSACATQGGNKTGTADVAKEAGDAVATGAIAVSSDPFAPLERRATDRWKLLVGGEAARAYQYLTPGYRATKPEKEYVDWVRARQVVWSQALYQDHECSSPESCKVGLQLTVKVKLRGVSGEQETTTYISEQWLKLDNVWYHFPKESI